MTRTFLGVPSAELHALPAGADIVILSAREGTPYKPGQTSHAASAPDALRAALARHEADTDRWDFDQDGPLLDPRVAIVDAGEIATSPATPERNRQAIRAAAEAVLAQGATPVLLGGDDSVPIPFFEAFARSGPITILQIDAHLDWLDQRGGLSHTFSSTMRRASELPFVERIVQVGLRGIGGSRREELEAARAFGSHLITAAEIARDGVGVAIEHIPEGTRCLVTIDCDGLDPATMPSVIVPQPGGLSYLDMLALLDGVVARATVVGCDLVELVPERDVGGLGTLTAARLVCKLVGAIGKQRLAAKAR